MSQIKIKVQRHIAKAISYRLVGTLTTIIIGFILTGNLLIASSLGFVEILIKPLIYFLHERVWYKWIKYGVVHTPDKKTKVKSIPKDELKMITHDEQIQPKPKTKKTLNYTSNR